MRIERVIVKGLRALRDRDDRLVGANGHVHGAVCLRGLNGSGKSTYLEMLAQLWIWFRNSAMNGGYAKPSDNTELLQEAALTAALFTDLPGPRARMWIAYGSAEALQDKLGGEPDSPYSIKNSRVVWDEAVLTYWTEAFGSAESGLNPSANLPSMISIEAENKWVPELRDDELTRQQPTPSYVAVARYLPTARGPSHLEGMMRALFLARRDRWETLAKCVAEARPTLKLLDRFDEATQRPLFQLGTGELLTVDRLSAGERSFLINLCMVLRWQRPGSIVLLDEPELHQHVSLMAGSLAVLDSIITSREIRGQLIVASHAPEVWDHFRRPGATINLSEMG